MDFILIKLRTLEERMNNTFSKVMSEVNVPSLSEMDPPVLMRKNKETLANMILSLVTVFDENVRICKSAAEKIDELKSDQISLQNKLLKP